MSIPWLTILWALPVVGAVLVALLPRRATAELPKQIALGFSLATLVLAGALALDYRNGGGRQFTEEVDWIKQFGAHYALGLDGIGLTLVLLTAILAPLVIIASWSDGDASPRGTKPLFAWMLALEGLSLGVFAATDVFLFYVFFEATLIPVYFLVAGYGGPDRVRAAVKFLLFSLAGGLIMLGSVIGLYVETADSDGGPTYLLSELVQMDFGTTAGRWMFLGFFIAFAIKAPMFPVHTWLPDTTENATPGTSVMLVSVLDKVGTFGMIRFGLELFPEASRWATPVVVVLAVFSILYGAFMAIGSKQIMRLIGYTSISHFGFIVLGIFVMNSQGLSGANFYMFNHGLSTAAMFLLAGFLISRRGSAMVDDFGGVEKVAPVLAGLFLVSGLSMLALPGLSPFVSELLVLVGAYVLSPWAAAFAVPGIVLVAVYTLWLYQRTMTGPVREGVAGMRDLGAREIVAVAPLLVLMVVLGFFPQPLLSVINPAVEVTMTQVEKSDPPPVVPGGEPMNTFNAPSIDYFLVSPILIVLGVAVVGVLLEAFLPRRLRYGAQVGLALVGLTAAIVTTVMIFDDLSPGADNPKPGSVEAMGALAVDGPALFCWLLVLVLAVLSVLLFAERRLEGGVTAFAGQAAALPGTEAEREASTQGLEHTEVFPLMMFAVGGMLMFPASQDLLTMFVSLEVLSLPLYLLCGLARRRRLLSQEAAMKYFLLGAFSSGFFVYGIALTYGYAGSMGLAQIAEAVASNADGRAYLLGGIGLMSVGLLFKVSAAPFHAWTPDVYQGAPTSVTAFMAAATKVAAFGAMLRLFYVAFGANRSDWIPMVWTVAILTMLVGSVLALTQTDVKRLLAYSSIAHAGFILTGFLGIRSLADVAGGSLSGVSAVLFYLTTYGFTTIAAFALVTLVRDGGGEATHLSRWQGLGKESPVVAGLFAFLLLAMAGIPLTSGFMGKWAVFAAALAAGAWPVVLVGILASAIAVYFYIRVIVLMFFAEPVGEGPSVAMPSMLTSSVIAVGVAATLVLGLLPGELIDLLGRVGVFVR